jgi:hypothetical protein
MSIYFHKDEYNMTIFSSVNFWRDNSFTTENFDKLSKITCLKITVFFYAYLGDLFCLGFSVFLLLRLLSFEYFLMYFATIFCQIIYFWQLFYLFTLSNETYVLYEVTNSNNMSTSSIFLAKSK